MTRTASTRAAILEGLRIGRPAMARSALITGAILLTMALAGALAGCGGGDPEDQPDSGRSATQPVNCAQPSEACK